MVKISCHKVNINFNASLRFRLCRAIKMDAILSAMWPFRRKHREKKAGKMMKKMIVGVIIGGAIGSIIGKKLLDDDEVEESEKD